MRTPPTPAFPFPNDVGKSQGNSAIGDHNTQYNISPALTMIRGKHTLQAGAQFEIGLDNYFQTNIASGAFAFGGNWTPLPAARGSVWIRIRISPISCWVFRKIRVLSSTRLKELRKFLRRPAASRSTARFMLTTLFVLPTKLTINLGSSL